MVIVDFPAVFLRSYLRDRLEHVNAGLDLDVETTDASKFVPHLAWKLGSELRGLSPNLSATTERMVRRGTRRSVHLIVDDGAASATIPVSWWANTAEIGDRGKFALAAHRGKRRAMEAMVDCVAEQLGFGP